MKIPQKPRESFSNAKFVGGLIMHISATVFVSIADTDNVVLLTLANLGIFLFYLGCFWLAYGNYYYKKHWVKRRLIVGILYLIIGVFFIAIYIPLNKMGIGASGLLLLVCGIIIIANSKKLWTGNNGEPNTLKNVDIKAQNINEMSVDEDLTENEVRELKRRAISERRNAESVDINTYSALEIGSDGKLKVVDEPRYFSMRDIDRIAQLEGKKEKGTLFEYYCSKILEARGLRDIEVIGGSGDHGGDVLGRQYGRKVIYQCKCYLDKNPPVSTVRDANAAAKMYSATPYAITNSHFSKQTWKESVDLNVTLIDREGLQKLMDEANEFLKKEW